MMLMTWEQSYTIRAYEVDASNKARLSVLWDVLQDAASIHAEKLGFDFQTLQKIEVFWMLCRMRLDVIRYPEMGEKISVKTTPSGIDKVFAIRDYEVFDSSNVLIARGRSCWIIANRKTLRPERVKAHVPQLDNPVRGDIPSKILYGGIAISEKKVIVEYGDIDVNQHVNNGRYLHWIEDAMDADGLDPHPAGIQVNYIAEEKKGAVLRIIHYEKEDKFYYEIKNQEDKLVLQVEGF